MFGIFPSSSFMFRAPSVYLGCTAAWRLIVLAPYSILTVPTFAARCLSASYTMREFQPAKSGTIFGRETWPTILPRYAEFHVHSRVLLHAVNLRYGTDGFTSPPKEGVLRIFFALKNPTASAGFEPANLGTKAQHATPRPPNLLLVSFLHKLDIPVIKYGRTNISKESFPSINSSLSSQR